VSGIAPSAEIAPVEVILVLYAKENEKSLLAGGFFGFEGVLVVSPVGIAESQADVGAESQADVGAHSLLCDLIAGDRPLTELVLLEGAIPD